MNKPKAVQKLSGYSRMPLVDEVPVQVTAAAIGVIFGTWQTHGIFSGDEIEEALRFLFDERELMTSPQVAERIWGSP